MVSYLIKFLKKLKYLRVSVRIRWIRDRQVDWCSALPNCHSEDGADPDGEVFYYSF